jgi:hypothetical protein
VERAPVDHPRLAINRVTAVGELIQVERLGDEFVHAEPGEQVAWTYCPSDVGSLRYRLVDER